MKLFLFVSGLAFISIQSLNAAVLNCTTLYVNTCPQPTITDVTSPNEVITVIGKPAGFVDKSTTGVFFPSGTIFNYVPTQLFKIFPSCRIFNMYNVSLTNVVSNAFTDCGNLETLFVNLNNFSVLPASFASACTNLTYIYMNKNNIKTIDVDAFKGLISLKFLQLGFNLLTCIPPGVFQHTPLLGSIYLDNNQITKLDPMTFKGLPNLNYLYLINNQIASIPLFDLTNTATTSTLQVFLLNNPIMAIHPQILTKLFTLRQNYTSTSVSYYYYGNLTSCISKSSLLILSILTNQNWMYANSSLSACYSNWGPAYETPVSCAPQTAPVTTLTPLTTSTTEILSTLASTVPPLPDTSTVPVTTVQPTTKSSSSGSGGNTGGFPWLPSGNFFAIISNAMRNFSANVNFY